MKSQKTIMFVLLSWILCAISGSLLAQKYGGSAYVYVKDDNNNVSCINVVLAESLSSSCATSASKAKNVLYDMLEREKSTREEFTSNVSYDIQECITKPQDVLTYDASASVEVAEYENKNNKRIINIRQGCGEYKNIPNAKSSLLFDLDMKKSTREVFIGPINFDIRKCDL